VSVRRNTELGPALDRKDPIRIEWGVRHKSKDNSLRGPGRCVNSISVSGRQRGNNEPGPHAGGTEVCEPPATWSLGVAS